MGTTQDYTTKKGALFLQVDGPCTKPIYVGCHEADDLEEGKGDIELLHCFDELGRFATAGFTDSAPDPVSTSFMTYISKTKDWLEKLAEDNCGGTIYFHLRCDGKAGVFGNYQRSFYFQLAKINSLTRSGLLHRSEDNVSEHSFGVQGLPPVRTAFEWTPVRVSTASTAALQGILFSNEQRCQGPCGAKQDTGKEGYIASAAVSGSATNVADVLKTTNSGGTWAATTADPFAAGEDIGRGVSFQFGRNTTRIIVPRAVTDAGEFAEIAYSDDGGDSWVNVDVGSVTGQYITSMYAVNGYNIWAGTDDGYIYYSDDGGGTWAAQESGSLTTDPINTISFASELVGYAGSDSDVIMQTLDGGTTWGQLTASGDGGDITAIVAHDRNFFLIGTSTGKFYVSFDGGATYTERTFSGSGASGSSITSLDFLSVWEGVMVQTLTGGDSVVFTTIDGGFTWELVASLPTNSGINHAVMIASDLIWAVGNLQGSTGYITKITAGVA